MFADVNGIRMHYGVTGSGDPVVLIGGFGANAEFWDGVASLLDGYTVVTFDNRGVGETEYGGRFSIDDLADDVVALMDHLGIAKAHVLGWSMGSQVGQSLGRRHPDRLRSLVLVSTYAKRPSRMEYMLSSFTRMAVEGTAPVECLAIAVNAFCFTEDVFRELDDEGKEFPIPEKIEDPRGLMDQLVAIDGYDTFRLASGISVPTMVVHGEKDIMVEPEEGEKVAALIEGSRLLLIPSAGHSIQFELYADAVRAFFDSH